MLAKAGTMKRDKVEQRIIDEVAKGTTTYQGKPFTDKGSQQTHAAIPGIIDTPADAGGWPIYNRATPVADNDHDGMADDWEVAHGFDPSNPEDRNTVASREGYTALEIYLCSLMGEKIRITRI